MLQVSKQCEDAIRLLAPPFKAVDNAPSSYKALRDWQCQHRYLIDELPVYSGNSENTIFSSAEVNWAFRAWHDALHLEHRLSFKLRDELKVALLHVKELQLMGITGVDADLIFRDVAGQALYHAYRGAYVNNQQLFHQHLFWTGLEGVWTYEQ